MGGLVPKRGRSERPAVAPCLSMGLGNGCLCEVEFSRSKYTICDKGREKAQHGNNSFCKRNNLLLLKICVHIILAWSAVWWERVHAGHPQGTRLGAGPGTQRDSGSAGAAEIGAGTGLLGFALAYHPHLFLRAVQP